MANSLDPEGWDQTEGSRATTGDAAEALRCQAALEVRAEIRSATGARNAVGSERSVFLGTSKTFSFEATSIGVLCFLFHGILFPEATPNSKTKQMAQTVAVWPVWPPAQVPFLRRSVPLLGARRSRRSSLVDECWPTGHAGRLCTRRDTDGHQLWGH